MKLTWDEAGSRLFETGVQNTILFPAVSPGIYGKGVAWSGVSSISISPTGAEPTPIIANNVKIAEYVSAEDIGASIRAFTYPDEFAECDGSVQPLPGLYFTRQQRKRFSLAYRTELGNDLRGRDYGYKIHILYNCAAKPTEREYESANNDPNLLQFEWDISTIPEYIEGYAPTSYVVIDTTQFPVVNISLLNQILNGTDYTDPRLPTPDELIDILEWHDSSWEAGVFPVLDNSYYPDPEPYTEALIGFYRKLDERRF